LKTNGVPDRGPRDAGVDIELKTKEGRDERPQ
jgi:hypothetical protein